MRYQDLPKDIQQEIDNLAAQYPLTIGEVIDLYLMGGEHASYLCQLKSMSAPDVLIQLENQRLWNEQNKILWGLLSGKGGDAPSGE